MKGKEERSHQMVAIKEARIVDAPADRIWEIVSDVDRDPEYWNGLNSVRNLRKEENLVERGVTVGFMGRKSRQKIELKPKESVELTMTQGPLKGSREIRLTPKGGNRTKVDVSWAFEFSGVPSFARPFVRSQIERGTRDALLAIAGMAVEGGQTPPSQAKRGE